MDVQTEAGMDAGMDAQVDTGMALSSLLADSDIPWHTRTHRRRQSLLHSVLAKGKGCRQQ